MKPKELNSKAKEAFAKSGIDVGVGVFKAVMLVLLILPMTLIIKIAFEGGADSISVSSVLDSLSIGLWIMLGVFYFLAMLAAFYFRDTGVKILHEMENEEI